MKLVVCVKVSSWERPSEGQRRPEAHTGGQREALSRLRQAGKEVSGGVTVKQLGRGGGGIITLGSRLQTARKGESRHRWGRGKGERYIGGNFLQH